MTRFLLLCALLTSVFAQNPPPIYVRNAASGTILIAPGSFVAIYSLTTPFPPDAVISLTTADGVGARLTPILPPGMPATGQPMTVWAVVPPTARLGSALITVAMNAATYNAFIELTATAPGIFTSSNESYGPAKALNYPSTRNGLTSAAVPNGIVSLFATGLNGAKTADVTIQLADQTITPLYAGPQGQSGLDQINFAVPQDAQLGCYVPVGIAVRGQPSNTTSIAINRDPFACAHPLGLSYSDLKTLDSGGSIYLASVSISSFDDSTGNDVPGATTRQERADFSLTPVSAFDVAMISGPQSSDAQWYSCFVFSLSNGAGGAATGFGGRGFGGPTILPPDPGKVTLTGPDGQPIELERANSYSFHAPSEQYPYFLGGAWRISSAGSADLGSFETDFALPPQLTFMNWSESTGIPSQGYTLRWNAAGFHYGDIATVNFADNKTYAGCSVPAVSGQMLLPESVLTNFKGKSLTAYINVSQQNDTRTLFSIPGQSRSPVPGYVTYGFQRGIRARIE